MISINDILAGIYRCNDIGAHISRAQDRRAADVAEDAKAAENYGLPFCLISNLGALNNAS